MDPRLRSRMAAAKVWWNRYQTDADLKVTLVCSKLRRAGLIKTQMVDKNHVTNVIMHGSSSAIPIRRPEDFVDVFAPETLTQVNPIVHETFPVPAAPASDDEDNVEQETISEALQKTTLETSLRDESMDSLLNSVNALSGDRNNIINVVNSEDEMQD